MFARVVADRYARAILLSCPEDKTIKQVKTELAIIKQTFNKFEDFRSFLLNPKIPKAVKLQILDSGLKNKISDISLNSLKLLISKNREKIIAEVLERFDELCNKYLGVEHVEIFTAVPITQEMENRLRDAVKRFTTRDNVEVILKVDPEIIGGVLVKLGGRVIDGSLKSRFEETRRKMLSIRLPGIS